MDNQEHIMEEHLDEEYNNSAIEGEFAKVTAEIDELEKKKSIINYDQDLQNKLEKAITLLRLHVQNYQRIIIFNRRRARQRLRRRQCTLRNFFLQSLMEMQIRFVEILPLGIDPRLLLDDNFSKSQGKEESLILSTFLKNCSETSVKDLHFYKDVVSKFNKYQWLETFHMSQNIFNLICARLKTSLDNIDMDMENWILMCIYMFASGSKFSSVAMLFNVEKKFVRQSLFKFSECLLNEFSEKMSMPNSKDELDTIADGFQKVSNMMPCVSGVLSLFKVPNSCECDRYSTCRSECLKVQVCVDNNLVFRKVEPTTHKPTMFLRAPNEINFYSKKFSEDCIVPYFIVAPDNYPLRNWLMKKYDDPREPWEYNFNKACGSLNIYREASLKRLFGRWHILDLAECILPESKSFIVKACCLLHNILEENQEYFSLEWCKNFDPAKYECKLNAVETKCYNESGTAVVKRNLIAKLMSEYNAQNFKYFLRE